MKWLLPSLSLPDYDGVTAMQGAILHQNGIKAEESESFLRASIEDLEDPILLKDAKKAASFIRAAIDQSIPITIYGDYDADGITGTALFVESLRKLGADVDWYINSRFVGGFGMQAQGVEEIAARGIPRLIVTVDNGINAFEGVQRANELGMDVIITDHHEPDKTTPPAKAIVNPKQHDCPYPFKDLAGVGVAFKVLQILFEEIDRPKALLRSLDLVALGTVADVMPIRGENRIFVKNGLKLINWGEKSRLGFQALRQVAGLKGEVNSHYHLGFIFGPLINAKGRLEGVPVEAVELLLTSEPARAYEWAGSLKRINQLRQQWTETQTAVAHNLAAADHSFHVLYDPAFHEGIVGLIASRLKERFYRPILVLTDSTEKGIVKGSARSVKGFSLKKYLVDACADLLVKGGGHDMAAGCSLYKKDIPLIRERLQGFAGQIAHDIFEPVVEITALVRPEDISVGLIEEIEALAPYGVGFSRPQLLLAPFVPEKVSFMGAEEKHLKMGSQKLEVIAFQQAESFRKLATQEPLALLGLPEISSYNGAIQFKVKDKGIRLYEDILSSQVVSPSQ
ncbi:single-stranded-DNA-specific exonuclease RecJ [Heliorestis acidaminivorans]|uniref:Single-stranded-DNA-specific exonuclease RecJ n=1 Tax=Heliorestis acidaminivorans TaxID=553427 RepID=A0A6I0EY56_9FIRM|nr:single-stranded-DNA-specific exonuclease RecJ [Heliorestis acidaminivorans]KAB2952260.1 single-stranded-DNA-specific exonuclease RecJ [Heliorestis acidaminivorans]